MAAEGAGWRFRAWYATLLRLYPRPFQDRFGEGMRQTFDDLYREQCNAGRGMCGLALWMYGETLAGIVKENTAHMPEMAKTILRVALGALGVWMVPLVASQFVADWHWSLGGFVRVYVLFFATGMAFALIARRMGAWPYKAGVGLALAAGFALGWSNMVLSMTLSGFFVEARRRRLNIMNMRMISLAAMAIASALLAPVVLTAGDLKFAVASIHPSDPNVMSRPLELGPNGLWVDNATLKDLLTWAEKIKSYQIIGGPSWFSTQRFAVHAKTDFPASDDQVRQMIESLLKDRFRLEIHKGSQTQSVYVLSVLPNGAHLTASKDGAPHDARGAIQLTSFGVVTHGSSMRLFAEFLGMELGKPVLDQTQLVGFFDLRLKFDDPDLSTQSDVSGSIFSALQSVGLRLRTEKTPVDVVFVDHADAPSEN